MIFKHLDIPEGDTLQLHGTFKPYPMSLFIRTHHIETIIIKSAVLSFLSHFSELLKWEEVENPQFTVESTEMQEAKGPLAAGV